jgi:hypothetical protein
LKRFQAGQQLATPELAVPAGTVVHVRKSQDTLRHQYAVGVEGQQITPSLSFEQYVASLDMMSPELTYVANPQEGSCTCLDWVHRRMPCKHIFASLKVLGKKFSDLPAPTRNAVHLVADTTDVEGFYGQLTHVNNGAQGDDEDDGTMDESAFSMEDMDGGEEACETLSGLPSPTVNDRPMNATSAVNSNFKQLSIILEHLKHWQSLAYRATNAGALMFLELAPNVEAALLTGVQAVGGGQHSTGATAPSINKESVPSPLPDVGVSDFPSTRPRGRPKGVGTLPFPRGPAEKRPRGGRGGGSASKRQKQ